MKKILLSVSLFFTNLFLSAQPTTFEWAKNMGGYWGKAYGRDVALDILNNVYTIGEFQSKVDFDPGSGNVNLTSFAGSTDIFISKLDASGNFVWAKQLGGTSGEQAYSISVDASGNIYTTGYFYGTADFDPGTGTFNLTSSGNADVFVSKLDASGNFVWAKKFGGLNSEQGNAIAMDASGNIFMAGNFAGTADFDPGAGTYNLTSVGSNADIFISKLDASGNFMWAKQLGGSSFDNGYSIAIDGSGNVYTTGYFKGTVDFDPGAATFNLIAAGAEDIFIVKLDASGNFVWAKVLGGLSTDKGNSIAVDGLGNVFTTGYFKASADFDPDISATYNLTAVDSSDIFISKLDGLGNFIWAKQMGGNMDDYGNAIGVDGNGNVYTTGNFYGTADFDPGAGTFNLIAAGDNIDIFISKLDASGNLLWAKRQGGLSSEVGNSLVVDASGNIYNTGFFSGTSDFDPGPGIFNLIVFGSSAYSGVFISKLNDSGNFGWAKSAGTSPGTYGRSVATDLSGNVYTSGYFFGTADFDPDLSGIFYLTSDSSIDVCISKSDALGNLIWAKRLGGISDDYAYSIAVDPSGNVFTTGNFKGTSDFDPGAGVFNLTSAGTEDIFIVKLDASGNFVWAKKFGGTAADQAYSIAVDGSGNIYTTGYFSGTADFDPDAGTFNLTSAGSKDIFISKLNASGNFLWAKKLGGISSDIGNSVAVDGNGNVFFTGDFAGTVDFDPGTGIFNLIAAGQIDVFISKLDAAGNFLWAGQAGGTTDDHGHAITVDGSGNVYATGIFTGTADFDPDVSGTFNLSSPGGYSTFITKLNASGNLTWAKSIRGSSSGNSVAVDGNGNVYSTGYFAGSVDFDPDASGTFYLTSFGGNIDIFISKLDASGNFGWAKQLGGLSLDNAYSIAVDGSGNVYTTGYFQGTVDFDPGAGTSNLTSFGVPDLFIHKMSQCIAPSASISPAGPVTFCSGNSAVLNANTGTGLIYQWKKDGTDISGETNAFYSTTISGSYSVVVTNACGTSTSAPVSVTVNSLPSATITAGGPTTFCSGGSVVLNAVIAANRTYQWKKNGVDISGAALSSYTATIGATYKVTVTNTVTGCSKTSASGTKVIVNAKPAATITPQGPITFCAGGSVVLAANTGTGLTYKWKKGGNNISGATLSNYTATTQGTYRVEVTNSNGCSKLSPVVTVTVPCKLGESGNGNENENESVFEVKVFPNPSSGDFVFEIENAAAGKISINVFDIVGKLILSEIKNNLQFTLQIPQSAPGIYSAIIVNGENKRILKLVKK